MFSLINPQVQEMTDKIIIRVQCPDQGTKRVQPKPTERVSDFLDLVQKEFNLGDTGWKVYRNRDKSDEIRHSRSKTLNTYRIKHGDMLYLYSSNEVESKPNTASASILLDEVDQILEKQNGQIPRPRNEQMCRHGPQGKCFHCVPLEPYDETYLASVDPPIKFLSFHSYIRKLTSGVDKGKFVSLENMSCKIKEGCREHPPWPAGICTKCQPNAVTLNRQKFRHIDYIQFENPFLMERFLNYWRKTGAQRIGFMYGRYEPHKDVPLGIKAVVTAIYEPPQKSSQSSVTLLDDPCESSVSAMAEKLGLHKVGWIFTDLVAKDLNSGTVKHFRGNVDSHFLSAEECIMAAHFQNKHPNSCKLSPEGHFGSKFVTVVATGDKSHQIHFEGYQVSDQCMALVRDDCLVPTVDASELAYVKESTNEQYVPDVFYKIKDDYGNEVTQIARPLPVEYLLVDMSAAFPVEPSFTFYAGNEKPFPIENRQEIGDIQDFSAFSSYMNQFPGDKFLDGVSDFHILLYMSNCDMLPLKEQLGSLLEAVRTKDHELAHHWTKCEEWATVLQLMQAQMIDHHPAPEEIGGAFGGARTTPLPPIGRANSATGGSWNCKHCTFINTAAVTSCEMCSLPK